MKREEAKAVLYEWQKSMVEHGVPIDTSKVQALRVAIEALSAERWIPCPERLPNVGENVLFTTDNYGGYVAEGDRRADGKWWQYRWNTILQDKDVIAWMPLPTPYKGGDDE